MENDVANCFNLSIMTKANFVMQKYQNNINNPSKASNSCNSLGIYYY